MTFSKKFAPSEEIELNSSEHNYTKPDRDASFFNRNKKAIVIITVIVISLAGVGNLIGFLVTPKNSRRRIKFNNKCSIILNLF